MKRRRVSTVYESDLAAKKVTQEVEVASDLILQAQSDLEKALENKVKCIQKHLIEIATAKLKVGNERVLKFEEDLCKLEKKKNKLMSSK